jgi:hypothetical protein
MFERIPRPLVGRVAALTDAIAWSAMPFGGLLAPLLIALAGLSGAFAICGVLYALATLVPALAARASFERPAGLDEPPGLERPRVTDSVR